MNKILVDLILAVYTRVNFKSIKTVEYKIVEYDDYRVLAIAGSHGGKDWIMNLWFIPIWSPTLRCFVHPGFWWGARALFNKEKELLCDGKPTIISCHSKGAGEGGLVAGLMTKAGVPPVGLALFGAPRCAFAKLGKILDDANVQCVRLVNDGDIVDNVPPAGFILRYRHLCDETRTGKDGLNLNVSGHDMEEFARAAVEMPRFFSLKMSG